MKILVLTFYIEMITIFCSQVQQNSKKLNQSWIPKILWTWWQNSIPIENHNLNIYQNNHKVFSKDWEVRHLDNTNQQYWLQQIPDYNNILHQQYFKYTKASKKSDLIRLLVTKHFGGVYLDYSIFLTQPLDWLLNPKQQVLIQSKFGETPDLVLLYNGQHESKVEVFDDQTNETVLLRPTYQSYFVAAKPKAKFTQQWFETYVALRKQSYKRYGKQPRTHAMTIVQQQKIQIGKFYGDHVQQTISAQILLQRKQRQFDREWEKDKNKTRILAVKYYNIWPINANFTACQLHIQGFHKNPLVIKNFLQQDINTLQKQYVPIRYFIKFYDQLRIQINKFWLDQVSVKNIKCPNNNFIIQNSYGYQFALKNYPVKFYSNEIVKTIEENSCFVKKQQFNENINGKKIINKTGEVQNESTISRQKQDSILTSTQKNQNNTQLINSKIQFDQSLNKALHNTNRELKNLEQRVNVKFNQKQSYLKRIQIDILEIDKKIQYLNNNTNQNNKKMNDQLQKSSNIYNQHNEQLKLIENQLKAINTQLKNSESEIKQFHEKDKKQINNLKQQLKRLISQKLTQSAIEIQNNEDNLHKKDKQEIIQKQNRQKQLFNQFFDYNSKVILYLSIIIIILFILTIIFICCLRNLKKLLENKNQIRLYQNQINENDKVDSINDINKI